MAKNWACDVDHGIQRQAACQGALPGKALSIRRLHGPLSSLFQPYLKLINQSSSTIITLSRY